MQAFAVQTADPTQVAPRSRAGSRMGRLNRSEKGPPHEHVYHRLAVGRWVAASVLRHFEARNDTATDMAGDDLGSRLAGVNTRAHRGGPCI